MNDAKSLLVLVAVVCLVACEEGAAKREKSCSHLTPENPYSEGTGHNAGYVWAQENEPGVCSGNSNSFIEGCEAYLSQAAEYEACLEDGR